MSHRRKILFVQATLRPPGGGNAVAAWMIEALKEEHSVSLLTWRPPNFEEINRYYGTSLNHSQLTVRWTNPVLRGLINLDPDPESIQKLSYLMRVCKRLNKDYDVVISTEDEVDFGWKGIQYVHYPTLYKRIQFLIDLPWHGRLYAMLKGQYRPWMLLSGFSYNRMKNNLTLVNSDWTGTKVKEFYGIETKTVHPPAPGNFPDVPWGEKENGFVCIGRFHPGKRFERIVEILDKVRSTIPGVHLHIVGTSLNRQEERDYYKHLINLVQNNASWVFLHENLSREEVVNLLVCHRYGIHANENEHFGIPVAEMVKAGCIPFIPNDGGQVEIVGGDERLVYSSEEEAAEKIIRVMSSSEEQNSICAYLNSRKELFSTEKFTSQIRDVVRQFCNSHSSYKNRP